MMLGGEKRLRKFIQNQNFEFPERVERVVWGKSDGNMKDAHGQA